MGIFKELRQARKARKEVRQETEQLQQESGMRSGMGDMLDMMKQAPGMLAEATQALQQAQGQQAESTRLQAEGVPGMARLIQARDAGITMTGLGAGMDSPVADLDLEVTVPGWSRAGPPSGRRFPGCRWHGSPRAIGADA